MLSSKDIATRVGCTQDAVPRVAKKHGIGEQVGRVWVFTAADAERLAKLIQERPGNPGFVIGHRLGNGRKPRKSRRK